MSHAPVVVAKPVPQPAPPAYWRGIDGFVGWLMRHSRAPRVMCSGMAPQPNGGPAKLTLTPAKEIGRIADVGIPRWIDVIWGVGSIMFGLMLSLLFGLVDGPPNVMSWLNPPKTEWFSYTLRLTIANSLGWYGLIIGLVWGILAKKTSQLIDLIGRGAIPFFGIPVGFLGLHIALFGMRNAYMIDTPLDGARITGLTLPLGFLFGLIILDQYDAWLSRGNMPNIETHTEARKNANHLRNAMYLYAEALAVLALGIAFGWWSGSKESSWAGTVTAPLKDFVLYIGPFALVLGLALGSLTRWTNHWLLVPIPSVFTGISAHFGLLELAREKMSLTRLFSWQTMSGMLLLAGFVVGFVICTHLQHRSVQEDAKALAANAKK